LFIPYRLQIILLLFVVLFIFYFRNFYCFFGFEYEDCFVYIATAIDHNILLSTYQFRTYPIIDTNQGELREFFTGHFVTYAYYLRGIWRIFQVKEIHEIHVYANCLLLLFNIFLLHKQKFDLFIISLYAFSFLTIYTSFSALSENLSFTLILSLLFLLKNNYSYLLINAVFIACILTKRENLILFVPYVFYVYKNFKSLTLNFYISASIGFIVLLYINPFSTEFIESNSIGMSTFGLTHINRQFLEFLKSMINPFNGLIIFLIIYLKSSKKSHFDIVLITTGILLFLLYTSHYRSPLIISNEIDMDPLFTWRYLYNILPLFIVPLSEIKISKKLVPFSLILLMLCVNLFKIQPLILEEDLELRRLKDRQISTFEFPLKLKLAGCKNYGYPNNPENF